MTQPYGPPPGPSQGGQAPEAVGSPKKPLYKKKRVLIPAGFIALSMIGGALGDEPQQEAATPVAAAAAVAAPTASEPAKPSKAEVKAAAAEKAAAEKAAAEKAAAEEAAAEQAVADVSGPQAQQGFLQAISTGQSAFEGTDNELKQRRAQKARADEVCGLVAGGRVTDWVGEVDNIDTNGEGKGVLELRLTDAVKVATWNNAFSDVMDNTLIDMDSPLYDTMIDLSEGDRVRFSGQFLRDSENCFRESSVTFNGSMQTPTYILKFSKLARM